MGGRQGYQEGGEGMIQVAKTDTYIWSDKHCWMVGKKQKAKPTSKSPQDYRMVSVTYHGTLRQAVGEVFERELKHNLSDALNLTDMKARYDETHAWMHDLFPDVTQP